MPRRIEYDDKFFDDPNELNSYWAGVLAADGCIQSYRDTVLLGISAVDIDVLESFVGAIKYQGKIRRYPNRRDNLAVVGISGDNIVKNLARNFSIVRKKTYTLRPPKICSEKCIRSYIRGFMDGDGCITGYGCKRHLVFTNASLSILN